MNITELDVSFIDAETFAKAAREALERPSDTAVWDDRAYTTHGVVLDWADRSDDLTDESNYLMVHEFLTGIAGSEDNDDDPEDTVIDASFGHFAFGTIRHLFVRVRNDAGEYTTTFKYAVAVALALRDYSIFDEDDLSQREWDRFESNVIEAMRDCANDHDDSEADRTAIADLLTSNDPDFGVYDLMGGNGEIANYDRFAEIYESARDAYFDVLADPYVQARIAAFYAGTLDQVPGQSLLFTLDRPLTV